LSGALVTPDGKKDDAAAPAKLIYEAPLAKSIQSLKRVSATTAALSLLIPPALLLQGSESVPLAGQVAITATVLAASLGSTSLIHFLFTPYVLSMAQRAAVAVPTDSTEAASSPLGRPAGASMAMDNTIFEVREALRVDKLSPSVLASLEGANNSLALTRLTSASNRSKH
jgi:hypothetical protein